MLNEITWSLMSRGGKLLSGIQAYTKYGRFLEKEKRIESWDEIVDRNIQMHSDHYGSKLNSIKDDVSKAYNLVRELKVLPSMRSMQFGGKPIHVSPNRIYNCAAIAVDDIKAFSEAMFILLGGSGLGFSVQKHHISKLPPVCRGEKVRRYVVGDSKEGWAQAVEVLLNGYFGVTKSRPRFDYSDIRDKGTPLKTSGGRAPGPKPLRDCLNAIESILMEKADGEKLKTIEAHDIMCLIGNAVLSGGIRRSALISLFSRDDKDMLISKVGDWWEKYPFRGRANNSVVLPRNEVEYDEFREVFKVLQSSGYGEPGFFWTNDIDEICNPCAEISLKSSGQFCNLTNVSMVGLESVRDLYDRVWAASLIGTLQAGYTDFHYLRDQWKDNTERDALIGVGLTGIASADYSKYPISQLAFLTKLENLRVADIIGINTAARTTTVKPDGNTSVLLNSSPGIHAWHSKYFIRNVRINKITALYKYLMYNAPHLVEDDFFNESEAVVSVPVESPEGSILKGEESAKQLLDRVKFFHNNWIKPGHERGPNTNNVSCTVTVKDDEWESVMDWFWNNRNSYNGLSILPHDGHLYKQAPYTEVDEETFKSANSKLIDIDWNSVVDFEDNTTRESELACAGGSCEI
jgi:ribonucleoside-diphosphate reductase alpha chain